MTLNNKKIAVTGGIGSGKSTVLQEIGRRGHRVLSCDEVYRELLRDGVFSQKLAQCFGGDILQADGTLDRKKLAAIVFSDRDKLELLNGITHPVIMQELLRRAEGATSFCEVPLLFEGGYEKYFDGVIVVLRPAKDRISFVMRRDGMTFKQARLRIKNQIDYDNTDFAKYYVIYNNADMAKLREETGQALDKILKE